MKKLILFTFLGAFVLLADVAFAWESQDPTDRWPEGVTLTLTLQDILIPANATFSELPYLNSSSDYFPQSSVCRIFYKSSDARTRKLLAPRKLTISRVAEESMPAFKYLYDTQQMTAIYIKNDRVVDKIVCASYSASYFCAQNRSLPACNGRSNPYQPYFEDYVTGMGMRDIRSIEHLRNILKAAGISSPEPAAPKPVNFQQEDLREVQLGI